MDFIASYLVPFESSQSECVRFIYLVLMHLRPESRVFYFYNDSYPYPLLLVLDPGEGELRVAAKLL